MNKLISRNPILRFKEGRKIVKALDGLKTYRGQTVILSPSGSGNYVGYNPKTKEYNYNLLVGASELDTKIGKGNASGKVYKGSDGKWYQNGRQITKFSSNITPKENTGGNGYTLPEVVVTAPRLKRKRVVNLQSIQVQQPQVEQPTLVQQPENFSYTVEQLTPNGQFKPSGFTTADPREAVKSTIAELNPQPATSYLTNTRGITLNRGNIRSNRNLYSNVDEYWNYLNSDEGRNSVDYGLWLNLYGNEVPVEDRRKIFDLVMNTFGIRGNLGRRDSGRLANVLNTLSGIGTNGSAIQKSFINSYDNTRNALESNLLFANNYFKPQLTDWNTKIQETKNRYGLRFKKGGLISRNPVKQFKSNFRKEAL